MSSNIVIGLPALLGVVLGLQLYADARHVTIYVALLFVISTVCLIIGYRTMRRWPRVAWVLIEVWILSAIAVTAIATAVVTWISLSAPIDFIVPTERLAPEQVKTMATALITAITTYIALVWTKDIGDATGYFWPSTHFKSAIQKTFEKLAVKPASDTKAYQAIYSENYIEGYGPVGWDFASRRIRAKVLAEFILRPHAPAA